MGMGVCGHVRARHVHDHGTPVIVLNETQSRGTRTFQPTHDQDTHIAHRIAVGKPTKNLDQFRSRNGLQPKRLLKMTDAIV